MMRTHSQIIADADGVTAVRKKLAQAGVVLKDATVRSWVSRPDDRGSIPAEYWPTFEDLGLATREELNAGLEARRLPEIAARRAEHGAAA